MQNLVNTKNKTKILICLILTVLICMSVQIGWQNTAKAGWNDHSVAPVFSQYDNNGVPSLLNTAYTFSITAHTIYGDQTIYNTADGFVGGLPQDTPITIKVQMKPGWKMTSGNLVDAWCPEHEGDAYPTTAVGGIAEGGYAEFNYVQPGGKCVALVGNFVPRHSVTVASATGGSATTNPTSAFSGTTINITCSPSTGYSSNKPTVKTSGGTAIAVSGSGNSYSFTMPDDNVTVTPSFTKVSYTITRASATGGSCTTSKSTANYGDTITITCSPSTGYSSNKPTVSGVSASAITGSGNSWSFKMPAQNVTVTPSFSKINYTVTVGTATGGTAKANKSTAQYGDAVAITYTPSTGYRALKPTVSGVSAANVSGSGNSYSFSMPAQNVTVIPVFEKIKYNITGTGDYLGGNISSSSAQATMGEVVTIKLKPSTGWEPITNGDPYPVTVVDNSGNPITLTQVDNETYTFVMPANHVKVSGEFSKINYTVTVVDVANGRIKTDKYVAQYEDIVNIESYPDNGYKLDNIDINADLRYKGDNPGSIRRYDFSMPPKNVTITPSYSLIDYKIDVNVIGPGEVEAPETGTFKESIPVKPIPEEGYQVKRITTGPDVPITENPDSTYTVEMPATKLTVTVEFGPKTYNIDLEVIGKGSATVPSTGVYTKEIGISTSPDEGYQVKSITLTPDINVKTVNENTNYSFTMPHEDTKVVVEFTPIPHGVIKKPVEEGGSFSVYEEDDDDEITKIDDKIVINPMPDPGYEVDEVIKSPGVILSEEDNGTYTFDMPNGDVEVEVIYRRALFRIRALSDGHGAVNTDPTPDQLYKDPVEVMLEPDYGYVVGNVYADPDLDMTDYTFNMPANDIDVTGTFKKGSFRVITNVEGNGTVTVSDDEPYYEDKVRIGLSPEVGYKPITLKITPEVEFTKLAENEYEFIMPGEDVTVDVVFGLATYNINVVESEYGEIQGPRQAKYTEEVIFKPAPNNGYHLEKVMVSPNVESEALDDGTYRFIMPPNDVTIEAQYAKNKYRVTIGDTPNGKIWTDVEEIEWGKRVNIYTEGDPSYVLKDGSITVNGQEVEVLIDENGNYYFIMPIGDAIVNGAFEFVKVDAPAEPAQPEASAPMTSTFHADVNYNESEPEIINETTEVYDDGEEAASEEIPEEMQDIVIPLAEALNMEPEDVLRNLEQGRVPLSAGNSDPEDYWALLNLILMGLTILVAILIMVKFVQKNKERDKEENQNGENNNANSNRIRNNLTADQEHDEDEEEEKEVEKRNAMSFTSILVAIASLIIFIITENIFADNIMLTDKFTWLMAIIFFGQLILGYFTKKKYEDKDDDEQDNKKGFDGRGYNERYGLN